MSSTSTPIRVGILGLGIGDAAFAPGLWAAKAHLPYLLASPSYHITAISNSTPESAQKAIDHYNLGPSVKAYGNPADIAADPNVDLIVVSVRVAKHYDLTKPALLAGKDVFVEWPLAATVAEAEELAELAKEKGVKTIVGVQALASPLVGRLRDILGNGELGTILSSTVNATFSGLPHDMFPVGAEYYMDINSGGNPLTIFFGHFLDTFTHVLGPFSPAPLNALFKTAYPTTTLIDPSTYAPVSTMARTAPDHIFLHGTLASGAVASIAYRTVPTLQVKDVGVHWTITGTEGEVVVKTRPGQWQMMEEGDIVVEMRKGQGGVERVDLGGEDGEVVQGLQGGMRNTGRVWEAFVKGEGERYAGFGGAVETQRLVGRIREAAGK